MKKNRQQTAFTMIELVFVIIVIGILTALAMPRMERDMRQEAADSILSAIRYTQHMALIDDKHQFNASDWQQRLWMIRFEKYGTEWIYKIGADNNKGGNIDQIEAAIDPLSKKYLHTTDAILNNKESKNIFLTQKYGISNISFNACQGTQNTTATHLAFDNKGRPHRGILQTGGVGTGAANDFRTYVKNGQCEITFTSSSFTPTTFKIIILEETGYAYIKNQAGS